MSDNSLKLKHFSKEKIKKLLEDNSEYKKGLKLFAAYLLTKGWSARKIGKLMDVSFKQITLWIHDFDNYGEKGLEEKPRTGRTPKLTAEQKQKLKEIILTTSPPDYNIESARWKGNSIIELISKEYGIEYKVSQVYNIVKSIRIKYISGSWKEF